MVYFARESFAFTVSLHIIPIPIQDSQAHIQ